MASGNRHGEAEMNWQRGYTLVEMSIALVIIGLIVGGVMTGRELIRVSELRSSLSAIEKFNAATNSFRNKYAALPGDIGNAAKFGLGTEGGIGTNGSGDGSIYSYNYINLCGLAGTGCTEMFNFWYHLLGAGLITETVAGVQNSGTRPLDLTGYMPTFAFAANRTFVVPITAVDQSSRENFGNAYALTNFDSPTASIVTSNRFGYSLTALEAFQIDSKLDDGFARTGKVRAMFPTFGPYWSAGGGQACDVGGDVYDTDGSRSASGVESPKKPESIDCQLLIKANW